MSMRRLRARAAGGLVIALGAGLTGTLQGQGVGTDRQFVDQVADKNLVEVRLGQAAEPKAQNPMVKQFAHQMVIDHTTMQKQWMAAAQKNGIEFKADLNTRYLSDSRRLAALSGAEFDRAYMALMVQHHQEDVSSFQAERSATHSTDVRQLIEAGLPILQQHLTSAQQINAQIGGGVTATTGAGTDTTTVATQPPAPQPQTTQPPTTQPQTTQPVRTDSAFISEVNASNAAEIRLARMADNRAQNEQVKDFAEKLVTDHTRMNTELATVSSRGGLQVTANISPRHQEQVTRLGRLNGEEFDRAFMAAMVQNHQQGVSTFQTRGNSAQSAEVRQFVTRNLSTLQEHLTLAQRVSREVGGDQVATIGDEKDKGKRGNISADAQLIRDVDASHFLQIRLAQLAQRKGRDEAVKRFAEQIEAEHSEMQKQWSNMASKDIKKFKSGMGSEHRENLERLEKVSDRAFDREYMTLMIQTHNGYLNYWRKEGRAAKSAAVRQLVDRGLPTLEEHMDMAKRIGSRVGVDAKAALAGRRVAATK
jgi:putative membrane protein